MIQTDINYPEGLPTSLIEGHQDAPVSPFRRTPMANGRARQRRVHTSVPVMGNVNLALTGVQALVFEMFFRYDLGDGVKWFNFPRRLAIGHSKVVARFAGVYTGPLQIGPDLFNYSFQLEYFDRTLLPEAWAQFPQLVLGQSILDLAINREWPEA